MPGNKSRSWPADYAAAVEALLAVLRDVPPDVLLAAIPFAVEFAEAIKGCKAKWLTTAAARLRLLRRWSALRAITKRGQLTGLYQTAAESDPTTKTTAPSLRRWVAQWNAATPGGLAAGPASLLPRYHRPRRHTRRPDRTRRA